MNKRAEKKKNKMNNKDKIMSQHAIKKRKFQKQLNYFTSQNRHKANGETLSQNKKKNQICVSHLKT